MLGPGPGRALLGTASKESNYIVLVVSQSIPETLSPSVLAWGLLSTGGTFQSWWLGVGEMLAGLDRVRRRHRLQGLTGACVLAFFMTVHSGAEDLGYGRLGKGSPGTLTTTSEETPLLCLTRHNKPYYQAHASPVQGGLRFKEGHNIHPLYTLHLCFIFYLEPQKLLPSQPLGTRACTGGCCRRS